jgi:NAD(P) transhydrogenase subunit alpha
MDFIALKESLLKIARFSQDLENETTRMHHILERLADTNNLIDPLVTQLTLFTLACIIGYYTLLNLSTSLHLRVLSLTQAFSSVVIVGALVAAGPDLVDGASSFGLSAVFLVSLSGVAGFIIAQRFLSSTGD